MTIIKAEQSHIWQRETHEHYVEPEWCSRRLFEIEPFDKFVWDPFCGFGRVVEAALDACIPAQGTDVVDRGYGQQFNFWDCRSNVQNIVSNPPFDEFQNIALRCLDIATRKVALIWLVRTLPAAKWLRGTPLKKILYLTPRPSMPPGHTILAGEKPGGGKQDFCWLIWDHTHEGDATVGWLHRDQA